MIEAVRKRFHQDTIALALITLAAYLTYGLERRLARDNAIYYYSAKQLVLGVPPLASFFDVKTPLTSFFSAVGVAVAPLTDFHELTVVRALFIPIGLFTVLATQRLAKDIWGNRWIAWMSGLSLLALEPLLYVTLAGPRPKVLAVFFTMTTLLAIVRSRWLMAGVLASLGFLSWQPAAVLWLTAGVSSLAFREGARAPLRLAMGASIPLLIVSGYFAWVGALQTFLDSALFIHLNYSSQSESPIVHLYRMWDTGVRRIGPMFLPVMLGGLAFLVLSVRSLAGRGSGHARAFGPTALCFFLFFAFSVGDFQGVPDWLPMLPFACLGFARAWWELARWAGSLSPRLEATTCWVGVIFCAVFVWSGAIHGGHGLFRDQEQRTQEILREFEPGNSVVFIGATEFLALSNLRSATPHVLITPRGIVGYMEDTVPGGLAGWLEQRRTFDPKIIVTSPSEGAMPPEIEAWIREDRTPFPYKRWTVFAKRP